MQKITSIITGCLFIVILFGFGIINLILPDPEILESERRKAATLPELTWENAVSAQWMRDYERYSLDSFAGRDTFRTLKARFHFGVYQQMDNHGVFTANGSAAKLEKVNEVSIVQAAEKIERLIRRDLQGMQVYMAVIPDKSVYVGKNKGYPLPDYDSVEETVREKVPSADYIPLSEQLTAEAFYKTDLHWNPSQLEAILRQLGAEMDFETRWAELSWEELYPFYGGYYAQAALSPDTMQLPIGTWMDGMSVEMLDIKTLQMTESTLYHKEKFSGIDPYDVYLGGAQSLITIENPNSSTDKELYLFRDSFGSSIAPLLTDSYRKITMIDLRYIHARLLPDYVTFTPGSDVLILYGGQILNYAGTLMTE